MTIEMDDKNDKEKFQELPAHLLSEEFEGWYSDLIGKDELSVWNRHPHFYFNPDFEPKCVLKSIKSKNRKSPISIEELKDSFTKKDYIFSSNRQMREKLEPFSEISVTRYLEHMPPITSADLMQNDEKISKLLTLDSKEWFVAIEVDDPVKISENLNDIDKLADRFNSKNPDDLTVAVLHDWGIVGEYGHHFLISPFLGATLEQVFKQTEIDVSFKKKVLETIKGFATLCETEDVFWRDLAPRNILVPEVLSDTLVFIDYEHLLKASTLDTGRRHSLDISRRIWFGDILSQSEIDFLFSDTESGEYISGVSPQPADELERIVFSKECISQTEKDILQQKTAFIERRHFYSDTPVFGHRIGRYLTDFVPVEDEAKLYFALENMDYETFCRYMFIIQACVDTDSERTLANLYNLQNDEHVITSTFIGEVQHNLNSNKKLQEVLDKYERFGT